ncbi:MAG: anthranilate synthase component II [Stackebrandtia sp.]
MSSRVLVADCRDSFVYTIVDYLASLGAELTVVRTDELNVDDVSESEFDGILLSPGPGAPGEATACRQLLDRFAGVVPVLGVCLGHQVIAEHYGAEVGRAGEPRHGETSSVVHDGAGVFEGIASPFTATRYHSLTVVEASCPDSLEISARTVGSGAVMGLRCRELDVEGVQFHPEAVLSQDGHRLLGNWLRRTGRLRSRGAA